MSPLVLVPQFFGSLVFDRRTSRYLPFDRPATDLWLRLTREPIERVVTAANRAFLEHFERQGFLRLDGRFAGELRALEPPSDHLTGPLAVHLEIVGICNLTCNHCFAGELPRNDDALALSEIDALFETFARIGSFRIGLTGGEPLLRKDLFEILDSAAAHGLHPCLTTNGLLIDERIAKELGRRDFAWLNVSLDGATELSNDYVRGPGVFRRVREKLEILRAHARFTLAFTIMSTNDDEVEACVRLAEEAGAHTAVFRPLYPVGMALANPHLEPEYDRYAGALERLFQMERTHVRPLDPFSPGSRRPSEAKVHRSNGCAAGHLIASVSVRGDVNPCSFMGSAHDAGNVRERPFEEIWHRSAKFLELRGDRLFSGGCRARAQAATGCIHGADPWQAAYARREGAIDPGATLTGDRR